MPPSETASADKRAAQYLAPAAYLIAAGYSETRLGGGGGVQSPFSQGRKFLELCLEDGWAPEDDGKLAILPCHANIANFLSYPVDSTSV